MCVCLYICYSCPNSLYFVADTFTLVAARVAAAAVAAVVVAVAVVVAEVEAEAVAEEGEAPAAEGQAAAVVEAAAGRAAGRATAVAAPARASAVASRRATRARVGTDPHHNTARFATLTKPDLGSLQHRFKVFSILILNGEVFRPIDIMIDYHLGIYTNLSIYSYTLVMNQTQ